LGQAVVGEARGRTWATPLLLAAVVAIPLVFFPPSRDYTLVKHVLAGLLLAAAAAGLLARGVCLHRLPAAPVRVSLVFLFLLAPSSVLSAHPSPSSLRFAQLLASAGLGVLFWLALGRKDLRAVAWLWVGGAAVGLLIALVQRQSGRTLAPTHGNVNVLAAHVAVGLILSVALAVECRRGPVRGMVTAAISAVLLGCGLALLRSRGAWMGVWLALVVAALTFSITLSGLRARAGAGLALLCLIAGAVWVAADSADEVLSQDVRPPIWAGAADMAAARPLTGFGYGTFEYAYPPYRHPEYFARPKAVPVTRNAHCEPLQIAAESGLPAAAAFVALTVLSVSLAVGEGLRRRDALAVGFGLALLCLFAHNLVDVNMRFASGMALYWLLSGACWASAARSERTGEPDEAVADAPAGSRALGEVPLVVLLMALGVGSAVWTAVVPMRAGVYLRRGVEAREAGLWQTAVGFYRESVEADPYQMEARQRLGFSLAQLGELERAAGVYADALALVPGYADLERDLGSVLAALDRFDEALGRLTAWLQRDPYDDRALLIQTSILVETGRRDEALESAERLVTLRPELGDAASVVEQITALAEGEGDETPGP